MNTFHQGQTYSDHLRPAQKKAEDIFLYKHYNDIGVNLKQKSITL